MSTQVGGLAKVPNRPKIDAFGEYFVCLKSIEIKRSSGKPRTAWLCRVWMFRLFDFGLCITLKITLRDKRLTPMIQPSTAF